MPYIVYYIILVSYSTPEIGNFRLIIWCLFPQQIRDGIIPLMVLASLPPFIESNLTMIHTFFIWYIPAQRHKLPERLFDGSLIALSRWSTMARTNALRGTSVRYSTSPRGAFWSMSSCLRLVILDPTFSRSLLCLSQSISAPAAHKIKGQVSVMLNTVSCMRWQTLACYWCEYAMQ